MNTYIIQRSYFNLDFNLEYELLLNKAFEKWAPFWKVTLISCFSKEKYRFETKLKPIHESLNVPKSKISRIVSIKFWRFANKSKVNKSDLLKVPRPLEKLWCQKGALCNETITEITDKCAKRIGEVRILCLY